MYHSTAVFQIICIFAVDITKTKVWFTSTTS